MTKKMLNRIARLAERMEKMSVSELDEFLSENLPEVKFDRELKKLDKKSDQMRIRTLERIIEDADWILVEAEDIAHGEEGDLITKARVKLLEGLK